MSELKNVAASVRQRLLNRAKETKRPFDELLQYYAMERFLYRLSQSPHRDKFVLKGALMFTVWEAEQFRATRDIDLSGKTNNETWNLAAIVQDVCRTEVEPDGMAFDAETVEADKIKEDADYAGVRVRFLGHLERARASMQIDVGFGDVITPGAAMIDYPVILDMPAPRLKGYPRETVVAEKFHAMVFLAAGAAVRFRRRGSCRRGGEDLRSSPAGADGRGRRVLGHVRPRQERSMARLRDQEPPPKRAQGPRRGRGRGQAPPAAGRGCATRGQTVQEVLEGAEGVDLRGVFLNATEKKATMSPALSEFVERWVSG